MRDKDSLVESAWGPNQGRDTFIEDWTTCRHAFLIYEACVPQVYYSGRRQAKDDWRHYAESV